MADQNIFERVGAAFSKRTVVPTTTIGSSRTTMGDEAGTFDAPDREVLLTGTQRFVEFDRLLLNTTIVASGVRLFLSLVSNAVWTVVPPDGLNDNEQAVSQGYADQVYAELFGMTTSWSSVVKKTATFRLFGFSLQEWTAKRNEDGTIGLKDIENRPQRTISKWLRDPGGTVLGVKQRVPGGQEVEMPRVKLVYAVDDTLTDSPEGIGLMRHIAKTAMRLQEFLDIEEVGFSTDLRGIPIGRAPLGELQAEIEEHAEGSKARAQAESRRARMLQPLRNFINRHVRNKTTGVLLPSDTFHGVTVDKTTQPSSVAKWMLEILNGDATSFADVAAAINRMNKEIARVLGCEHLMLGDDGSGSLALAKSKIGTFYMLVTSTLLDLIEVYDRDIVAPMAELNGWEEHLIPQMGVNEISDTDIEQIVDALTKLAQAGAPVMPDDPAVGELYDRLGLTRPPERGDDMDLSLNPGRNDPTPVDPDNEMEGNPEDKVKKNRLLRSRRNMQKGRRKWHK